MMDHDGPLHVIHIRTHIAVATLLVKHGGPCHSPHLHICPCGHVCGGNYPFRRLVELKRGEMCWTLGTLYKKMDLKPSILKEISADVGCHGYSAVGVVADVGCHVYFMYSAVGVVADVG